VILGFGVSSGNDLMASLSVVLHQFSDSRQTLASIGAESARERDFINRAGLWDRFIAEDAAGKR